VSGHSIIRKKETTMSASTVQTLKSSWPLFFGLFMIMVGNGLQGTLLGVRASIEDFPTWLTGLIMSVYFVGFLLGTLTVPKFVRRVGHIRVFAALASLASITVLFHGIFVHPLSWLPVRLITGFSFCGLYIVVESWLNDAATNKNRGMMMAIYLIVNYLGIMVGQILMNIADPSNIELFITVSVLVSLALVPISLSARPAPNFEKLSTMTIQRLLKISPLGTVSIFQTGFASAAIFTILPVYSSQSGATTAQISIIMSVFLMGGMAFQIPIGWLSDRIDRRLVMFSVTGAAAALCFLSFFAVGLSAWTYSAVLFLFGGVSMVMYGLSVSHANDHVEQDEIVAVSSTMLLMNGIGACFGPILVTLFMQFFGDEVFYPFISSTYFLLLGFGLYRLLAVPSVPLDDQGDYLAMPMRSSAVIMRMMEDEEGSIDI